MQRWPQKYPDVANFDRIYIREPHDSVHHPLKPPWWYRFRKYDPENIMSPYENRCLDYARFNAISMLLPGWAAGTLFAKQFYNYRITPRRVTRWRWSTAFLFSWLAYFAIMYNAPACEPQNRATYHEHPPWQFWRTKKAIRQLQNIHDNYILTFSCRRLTLPSEGIFTK